MNHAINFVHAILWIASLSAFVFSGMIVCALVGLKKAKPQRRQCKR